jgi:hypothetical protein
MSLDERLYAAVNQNNLDQIECLLEQGASFVKFTPGGNTLIGRAVQISISATKALIVAGADVNASSLDLDDGEDQVTALFFSKNTVLPLLFAAGAEPHDYLHAAVYCESDSDLLEAVERFVAGGANYRGRDSHGDTLVQIAKLMRRRKHLIDFLELLERTDDPSEFDWYEQRRKEIADARSDLVRLIFKRIRPRCLVICIALQSIDLPALITLTIIDALFESKHASYHLIPMYLKWNLITTVKKKNAVYAVV